MDCSIYISFLKTNYRVKYHLSKLSKFFKKSVSKIAHYPSINRISKTKILGKKKNCKLYINRSVINKIQSSLLVVIDRTSYDIEMRSALNFFFAID